MFELFHQFASLRNSLILPEIQMRSKTVQFFWLVSVTELRKGGVEWIYERKLFYYSRERSMLVASERSSVKAFSGENVPFFMSNLYD